MQHKAQALAGMCIKLGDLEQLAGRLTFTDCVAKAGRGGGLHVVTGSVVAETMRFTACSCGADGGGFAVKQDMLARKILAVISCESSRQGQTRKRTAASDTRLGWRLSLF